LEEVGDGEGICKGGVIELGRRVVDEEGERVGHAWERGRS
jgi:hypothetical protein